MSDDKQPLFPSAAWNENLRAGLVALAETIKDVTEGLNTGLEMMAISERQEKIFKEVAENLLEFGEELRPSEPESAEHYDPVATATFTALEKALVENLAQVKVINELRANLRAAHNSPVERGGPRELKEYDC